MATFTYGNSRVNSTTIGYQAQPNTSALADGGYIVTWSDQSSANGDYIYTQRYSASGAKIGGETRVNASTIGTQEDPVVTGLKNGGYVVAWKVGDNGNSDVYVQRFNADGSKAGSQSRANTYSIGEQDSPSISALKDGGYVVSWASYGQDGSEWGSYLQRYDANGTKVGTETRINTTTSGSQDGPTITGLADGGYIAVWEGSGSGDSYGVFAQRFNSTGGKVNSEIRINTTLTGDTEDPTITVLANGGYVVTWQSHATDTNRDDEITPPGDIFSQLYNSSGVKIGGETLVNTTTLGNQEEPRVAALPDGGYVVVWNGNGSGDASGIFLQRFNSGGVKVGTETAINTLKTGLQEFSSITTLADGGYLITWESYDSTGNNPDVYSQRFDANGKMLSGLTGDSLANTLTWSGANSAIIDGGAGNDTLIGGSQNDHILGGTGNDTLNGRLGADRMTGDDGSDIYYVDNARDTVIETNAIASTGGIDTIYSYLNAHTLAVNVENGRVMSAGTAGLTGNSHNNVLYAGAGNNALNGGTGIDTASYAYAGKGVTVSLANTSAQATLGSGSDTLTAIENLNGSAYADTLTGNGGANILRGGNGNDSLAGSGGNDTLYGDAGNDLLRGGTGNDILYGGAGQDIFRFDTTLTTTTTQNLEQIKDFVAADDTIQLENSIFTKFGTSTTGTINSAYFKANTSGLAADSNDYIIYETDTGKLFYDTNGSTAGGSVQIALLGINLSLTAADFVLV